MMHGQRNIKLLSPYLNVLYIVHYIRINFLRPNQPLMSLLYITR